MDDDAGEVATFLARVYEIFLSEVGVPDGDGLIDRVYAELTDLANYALFDDVIPASSAVGRPDARSCRTSRSGWSGCSSASACRAVRRPGTPGIEGVEKPDPRIFLLAMDRAGVEPTRSVYVGDNPALDIEPALAVGMFPVLVDRRDRYLDTPGSRISLLEELPASWGSRDRPHLHRRRGELDAARDLRERLVRSAMRGRSSCRPQSQTERVATDGGGSHGGREYWDAQQALKDEIERLSRKTSCCAIPRPA